MSTHHRCSVSTPPRDGAPVAKWGPDQAKAVTRCVGSPRGQAGAGTCPWDTAYVVWVGVAAGKCYCASAAYGIAMAFALSALARQSASVGGRALGELARVSASLRGSKPLHPKGVLLSATMNCVGAPEPTGVTWVDEPGQIPCQVRVSRAVGVPAALPDISGLALRWEYAEQRCDLLFAGTGLGMVSRFMLVPRRSLVDGPLTTLLPLQGPHGPLLFAIIPGESGLRMSYASLTGPWRQFAELVLGAPVRPDDVDPDLRFRPIADTPVGLLQYDVVRRLRQRAYTGAREGFPGQSLD